MIISFSKSAIECLFSFNLRASEKLTQRRESIRSNGTLLDAEKPAFKYT